jgi:hypothetical protein
MCCIHFKVRNYNIVKMFLCINMIEIQTWAPFFKIMNVITLIVSPNVISPSQPNEWLGIKMII